MFQYSMLRSPLTTDGLRAARILMLLAALAAALLAVMLARGAIEGAEDGIASRVLALPDWPFQVPAVISLALWALVAARLSLGPPPPADA